MELSAGVKDLYQRLQAINRVNEYSDDVTHIEVDDIASKLARLYEQVRNTIDYREDYLLRRFAMERNLRRQLLVGNLTPKIVRRMIEDLIRGKYLPNGTLPETIVDDVEFVVDKYQYLFSLIAKSEYTNKMRKRYQEWLIGVMACEIDMYLSPEYKSDALVEAAFQYVKDRVKVKGQGLSDREKNIQIYIAIHRDLVVSDNSILSFHLLQLYFPDWSTCKDRRVVPYVADKFSSIYAGIQHHLHYPDQPKIRVAMKKEMAIFKIIKDLVFSDKVDLTHVLSDPEVFKIEAAHALDRLNTRIKSRIRRSSVRAIFYIFLTKMLLAFILEFPYDRYIVQHVNYVALAINILFPPILMFLMALTASMPGNASNKIILESTMSYVYGQPETNTLILLRSKKPRTALFGFFLYLFYFVLYGVVFGFIIYWLRKFNFNILSGGLFIFFVTAVSFFASRIRQQAKEFNVVKKRQGLLAFLLNFFSLPIIKFGHLLSSNISRINIFIFIFDFVLEAPFKLLVAVLENLFGFVREKQEEIYKE